MPRPSRLARSALDINARTLGKHHPDYALSLQSVGGALNLVGRRDEARTLVTQAIAVFEEALGPDHARVASAEYTLGIIDESLGELADAERHLRHARRPWPESLHGDGHVYVAQYSPDVLGGCPRQAETLRRGRPYSYRRNLESLAKDHNLEEAAAAGQTGLGMALLGLGRPTEALAVLDAALHWREGNDHNAREVAQTRLAALARAMVAAGSDRHRARSLAADAMEVFATDPGAQADLAEAVQWLDHVSIDRREYAQVGAGAEVHEPWPLTARRLDRVRSRRGSGVGIAVESTC